MPHRYRDVTEVEKSSSRGFPFASALIESFKTGYDLHSLKADLLAGCVVGLVALPLGMALAIASGVSPERGLYTIISAGLIIAIFGGSRFQVSGPTAAFVVLLLPITQAFGAGGLLLAGFLAGFILLLMGLFRLGRFIQFIPFPVTSGFTAGIGVVIATLQLKDFFGLQVGTLPENFIEKLALLARSSHTWSWHETIIGGGTLTLLWISPKVFKKIPAPLIALSAASVAVFFLKKYVPDLEIATLGTRFHSVIDGHDVFGIPSGLPRFDWPWNLENASGEKIGLSLRLVEDLLPSAFAIALLGAIESLLSAVVADGMTKKRHNPDAELAAQGMGNMIAPLFGGIAATGAIARTATNIRFGAQSPIASIVHALFVLCAILFFSPFLGYLPMAAMAALLITVAYHMSHFREFFYLLRISTRSDTVVLLLCFALTILFNMVIGVAVGVIAACLVFVGRAAHETQIERFQHNPLEDANLSKLPDGVVIYRVKGSLFFGAAQRALDAMMHTSQQVHTIIVDLTDIRLLDVSGVSVLDSLANQLSHSDKKLVLAGLTKGPAELILRSNLARDRPNVFLCETLAQATKSVEK